MKDHPLNPMRDPDLRRVLSRQSRQAVGLIDLATVHGGVRQVAAMIDASAAKQPLLIVDAIDEDDLRTIAGAVVDMPLITGAAGLAAHLPVAYREAGLLEQSGELLALAKVDGPAAILSGSCSTTTLAQVEQFARNGEVFAIDLLSSSPDEAVSDAVGWALTRLGNDPILVSASAPPLAVQDLPERLGIGEAGRAIETVMGEIAIHLVDAGVRRLVVAGGETSGAVVEASGFPGSISVAKFRLGFPGRSRWAIRRSHCPSSPAILATSTSSGAHSRWSHERDTHPRRDRGTGS